MKTFKEYLIENDDKLKLIFVGYSQGAGENTITVMINGVKYEYWFGDGDNKKRYENYKKSAKFKPGQTLQAIKSSAKKVVKL